MTGQNPVVDSNPRACNDVEGKPFPHAGGEHPARGLRQGRGTVRRRQAQQGISLLGPVAGDAVRTGSTSLRELVGGFNAHASHHYHLDTREISRSTLADANGKRPPEVFSAFAGALMATASRSVRREIRPVLNVLDSTSITLKGGGFEGWTAPTRTRNTQGIKSHLQLIADEALPIRAAITAANVNDVCAVQDWPPASGDALRIQPGILRLQLVASYR